MEMELILIWDWTEPILLYPGICDNIQIEKLTESLKSEKQLWSKIGLSAVDQSCSIL